jgi:hypothetical protein
MSAWIFEPVAWAQTAGKMSVEPGDLACPRRQSGFRLRTGCSASDESDRENQRDRQASHAAGRSWTAGLGGPIRSRASLQASIFPPAATRRQSRNKSVAQLAEDSNLALPSLYFHPRTGEESRIGDGPRSLGGC